MDDLQMIPKTALAKRGNLHGPNFAEKKLADAIKDAYSRKVTQTRNHKGIVFRFARVIPKTT